MSGQMDQPTDRQTDHHIGMEVEVEVEVEANKAHEPNDAPSYTVWFVWMSALSLSFGYKY